jgi:hypothetical protein
MTLDDAIRTAKRTAAQTGRQQFVVLDRCPGVDDALAFHAGDLAALQSVWADAQRIATVHTDGRIILLIDQREAA